MEEGTSPPPKAIERKDSDPALQPPGSHACDVNGVAQGSNAGGNYFRQPLRLSTLHLKLNQTQNLVVPTSWTDTV